LARDRELSPLSEYDQRYIEHHLRGKINKLDFRTMKSANARLQSGLDKIAQGLSRAGSSTPLGEEWQNASVGHSLAQLLSRFEEADGCGVLHRDSFAHAMGQFGLESEDPTGGELAAVYDWADKSGHGYVVCADFVADFVEEMNARKQRRISDMNASSPEVGLRGRFLLLASMARDMYAHHDFGTASESLSVVGDAPTTTVRSPRTQRRRRRRLPRSKEEEDKDSGKKSEKALRERHFGSGDEDYLAFVDSLHADSLGTPGEAGKTEEKGFGSGDEDYRRFVSDMEAAQ
jgi:hypothetical protein